MRIFALNHMTVPRLSYRRFVGMAAELGCVGVEVRNDLGNALFDGLDATEAGALAAEHNLRIFAVAEVSAFNDGSARALESLETLAPLAASCGAAGVSLIPRNDGLESDLSTRRLRLRETLSQFAPVLERHGVLGFVEPLGFTQSSLRRKAEAVEAIESLGVAGHFRLVHDTFHHYTAQDDDFFPEHTGMVHVSGVADSSPVRSELTDADRVLVDQRDRLDNLGQLQTLIDGGYDGPVSIEAFSPEIHALTAPGTVLSDSFHYMRSGLTASAA